MYEKTPFSRLPYVYLELNYKKNSDGVRAGAKRLGRKPCDKKLLRDRRLEYEEAQKKACVTSSLLVFLSFVTNGL